jgi:hypothetical protein
MAADDLISCGPLLPRSCRRVLDPLFDGSISQPRTGKRHRSRGMRALGAWKLVGGGKRRS